MHANEISYNVLCCESQLGHHTINCGIVRNDECSVTTTARLVFHHGTKFNSGAKGLFTPAILLRAPPLYMPRK